MGLYHPAVTVPGEAVVSTRAATTLLPLLATPSDARRLTPGEVAFYTTMSGTSMATPMTAGIAALLLEANPALSPAQVRSLLQITARPIAGIPFHQQGYGSADASAAVDLALALRGRPAPEIAAALSRRQWERDRAILAALDHPSRTWAFQDPLPPPLSALTHDLDVPAGTQRLKLVAHTPGSGWELSVSDATGAAVAGPDAVDSGSGSGTLILDLDLRRIDPAATATAADLAWGRWTVTLRHPLAGAVPSVPVVSDQLAHRTATIVASVFSGT